MKDLPWLRLYAKIIDDPIVKLLSFDDQRHFVWVLCIKRKGLLDKEYPNPQLRERAVAGALGVSLSSADEIRRRLVEVGLLRPDWQPVSWEDLQRESDSSTDRVRRHRERQRRAEAEKRRASAGPGVTVTGRFSNGVEEEEETEGEKENPPDFVRPPLGEHDDDDDGDAQGRGRREEATRLPDDFALTADRRAAAAAEGLDPDRTFAKFVDHWRAAAGSRARKCDWDAAWRNWCRTEADKGGARPPAPAAPAQQQQRTRDQIEAERHLVLSNNTARNLGLPPKQPHESMADFERRLAEAQLARLTRAAGDVPRGTDPAKPAPLSHSAAAAVEHQGAP